MYCVVKSEKWKQILSQFVVAKRKEFVHKLQNVFVCINLNKICKCKFRTETKAILVLNVAVGGVGVVEISIIQIRIDMLLCEPFYSMPFHLLFAIAMKISIWAAAWFTISVYLKLHYKQWILNYENNNQLAQHSTPPSVSNHQIQLSYGLSFI